MLARAPAACQSRPRCGNVRARSAASPGALHQSVARDPASAGTRIIGDPFRDRLPLPRSSEAASPSAAGLPVRCFFRREPTSSWVSVLPLSSLRREALSRLPARTNRRNQAGARPGCARQRHSCVGPRSCARRVELGLLLGRERHFHGSLWNFDAPATRARSDKRGSPRRVDIVPTSRPRLDGRRWPACGYIGAPLYRIRPVRPFYVIQLPSDATGTQCPCCFTNIK